jgi:hypothetical protein
METACSSETSLSVYNSIWCHNEEDENPNNYPSEKLKIYFHFISNNYCSNDNVADWAVSTRRKGKHVPTKAHPTIEGRPLLGNRLVNTYHSNEWRTIGRPLLGNAWVDTPDNNTWNPSLSNWCVFCWWSVPILCKKKWRLFENPCGGGVEYLHRDLTSRRRRRKGSLESETVKYGLKSQGTRTREWLRWRWPVATVNDRPVLR